MSRPGDRWWVPLATFLLFALTFLLIAAWGRAIRADLRAIQPCSQGERK
jgi:hypothetical protein